MKLEGKAALVSGGARGIGRAIVETLIKEGCKVVIADVLDDIGNNTVTELNSTFKGNVGYIHCDVTSTSDAQKAVEETVSKFGSLDILVNNAGITRDGLIMRMKENDWDLVLSVNLKGTFLMTQAAAKVMMKARSGSIVNISSVVGLMGNAGQTNYSASKAGVVGLTKSSAKELAGRGIRINAVAPGFIETEMTAELSDKSKEMFLENVPLKRAGQADDVAGAVLFFASEQSAYITGQVIPVCGGLLM